MWMCTLPHVTCFWKFSEGLALGKLKTSYLTLWLTKRVPFFVCFLFPLSMYFTTCKSVETSYYSVSQRRTYNFWWPLLVHPFFFPLFFLLSLLISFHVLCKTNSSQQKGLITIRWVWLSGSPGVLNHPLFPKESSTRFATNDFPLWLLLGRNPTQSHSEQLKTFWLSKRLLNVLAFRFEWTGKYSNQLPQTVSVLSFCV